MWFAMRKEACHRRPHGSNVAKINHQEESSLNFHYKSKAGYVKSLGLGSFYNKYDFGNGVVPYFMG